jgi:ABC-type sugar transport system substrate-binding protein
MRSSFRFRARPVASLFALSALSLLALTGCTKEQSPQTTTGTPSSSGTTTTPSGGGGKKKIVFVFKAGGIQYSEACKRGAEQASNDPAINAEVQYLASAEGTSEKQSQIVEQAIIGKADAIVVSPVDADAIVPALNKAADAGIKVFTWDSDAPKSKREFYVAAVDDVEIGSAILESLVKSMGGEGKVMVFSGDSTAANLNLHIKGVEEAAAKNPKVVLSKPYIYNNEDKTKAVSLATQALQANPDIKGIAGMNSLAPPSAGEAVRKLGLSGKVKVWGLALPSETKEYLEDGSVTGLYLWDPQKLTYLTAKLVRETLDGKAPKDGDEIAGEGKIKVADGIVTLPLKLEITKENVSQYKF